MADNGSNNPATGTSSILDTAIHYEIAGTGDIVVLIHAGISDHRMWDKQFDTLAGHYRVLRYDLRGFGKSSRPSSPYSDVEDLYALLNALNLHGQVHLIGSSMGANVALGFALQYPERTSSLILVSPGLSGFTDYGRALVNIATDIAQAANSGDLITAVELSMRLWVDGLSRPASSVNLSARARLHRILSENAHMLETTNQFDVPLDPPQAARLQEITAPTLIITGDRDLKEVHAIASLLMERIPVNVEQIVLPDVAHMLNVEKPEEFNQVILNYLHKIAPR